MGSVGVVGIDMAVFVVSRGRVHRAIRGTMGRRRTRAAVWIVLRKLSIGVGILLVVESPLRRRWLLLRGGDVLLVIRVAVAVAAGARRTRFVMAVRREIALPSVIFADAVKLAQAGRLLFRGRRRRDASSPRCGHSRQNGGGVLAFVVVRR
jgi:hypothetical protein